MVNVLLEEILEPEEEKKQVKPRYDWRFENSINSGNQKLEVDRDYNKWRINSILANHKDTVLYANEMNINYIVSDKMHYDYLFASIRKGKRYSKAETKEEKRSREVQEELIALVSEYYKYNIIRSKEAIRILSADQIEFIRKKLDRGGVK